MIDPDADMIDLGPVSVQEALSLVMGDVQAVGKDGRNTSQNFNFRGVDAVVNAVGPALRKHGVIVLPKVIDKTYSTYKAGSEGKTTMHQCIVTVEYTFVGPDGTKLVCSAPGEAADSGDKATAKAMSVAYRTALLQALCIPTDEPDPDAYTIERASVEIIPAAEAKTRLLNQSNEDTAVLMWADRQSESIPLPELDALIRTARTLVPA